MKLGVRLFQLARRDWPAAVVLVVVIVPFAFSFAVATTLFASDHPLYLPAQMLPRVSAHALTRGYGPTSTSVSAIITDTEVLVLQQVAGVLYCWTSGISVQGTKYVFYCAPSIGHSTSVRIERFHDDIEARTAFDTARGDKPLQLFRGYPSYSWEYHQEYPERPYLKENGEAPTDYRPMRYQIHSWQADRWLIYVEAFDDSGIPMAHAPLYVSELVYRAIDEQDLFLIRSFFYLPFVLKRASAARSR